MYFYLMKNKIEPCLALSIRRADRIISQAYNDRLSVLGIRSTQFSVLRVIDVMQKASAKDLQQHLSMEQPTVSRALKPLIRDGYILVSEGKNKKEKWLTLTPEGKSLFDQCMIPWRQAQDDLAAHLGPETSQLLHELSNKIVSFKS